MARSPEVVFGLKQEETELQGQPALVRAALPVRNAKLSQCETVRNVSHGLRRRPKRAKWAKLVPH